MNHSTVKIRISYNAKYLSQFEKIDCSVATILCYLIDLDKSKNSRIASKRIKGYTWVDYTALRCNLPLLRFKSNGSITPRIKILEEYGLIKTLNRKEQGKSKVYIKCTPKCEEMEYSKAVHVDERSIHVDERKPFTQMNGTVHVDESIPSYNTNVINTREKEREKSINPDTDYIDAFNYYRENFPTDFEQGFQMKNWKEIVKLGIQTQKDFIAWFNARYNENPYELKPRVLRAKINMLSMTFLRNAREKQKRAVKGRL